MMLGSKVISCKHERLFDHDITKIVATATDLFLQSKYNPVVNKKT